MKYTSLLLVFTMLFLGCTPKDKLKVGFLLPHRDRFIIESQFFAEKIKELGCEPVVVTTDFDAIEQLERGGELLDKEDIDLLIIAAVNGNTIAPLVREAKYKGIPVIAYNMLINNVEYDAFVSGDNKHLANLFCKSAINFKPTGNYVILGGDAFDRNGVELKNGIESTLKPYVDSDKIKVIYSTYIDGWNRSIAMFEFQKVISLYGDDIDVILSCNDDMADGVIEILEKFNLDKTFFISGQDASLIGVKNVLEGKQSMTVYHPAKAYGYSVAELAYAILHSKKIDEITTDFVNNGKADIPTVMVKSIKITKENVKKELVDTGIYTLDELRD